MMPKDLERSDATAARDPPPSWAIVQPVNPRTSKWCSISSVLVLLLASGPLMLVYVLVPVSTIVFIVLASPILVVLALILAPVRVYAKWYMPEGDLYLQLIMLFYKYLLFSRKVPKATVDMPVDKLRPKGALSLQGVYYGLDIQCPKYEDEDFIFSEQEPPTWIDRTFTYVEHSLKHLPETYGMTRFKPGESPVEFVMKRYGEIYPQVHQEWFDKTSDEALARLCISGLGAMRLERTASGGFVVRTNALAGLPVRPGLARYGGDCYLDANYRVTRIEKLGGIKGTESAKLAVVTPADRDWEYVKFCFRSTLVSLVTLVDHLYGVHLLMANTAVRSVREHLPPSHPARRFLTPFMFNTISVNDNAVSNLTSPGTMGPRNFALTDQATNIAFARAPMLVNMDGLNTGDFQLDYEKYYKKHLEPKGLGTPFHKSKLRFWRTMHKFVDAYMTAYYPTKGSARADKDLYNFVTGFIYQLNGGLGNVTMEAVNAYRDAADSQFYAFAVNVITRICCEVTIGHEQVGSVGVYAQDVSFTSLSWPEGELCGTKEQALHQAGLLAFTSIPMPKLMVKVGSDEDWSFLFPRTNEVSRKAAVDAFKVFQQDLLVMSQDEDANTVGWKEQFISGVRTAPDWPIWVHNPRYLETSVSV